MAILFYICLGLLAYVFFGYPLLLWVLGLLFGKTIGRNDACPPVSVLISAYNEKSVIVDKIENSLALDYPADKLEIIVASESTDGTNEIVKEIDAPNVVLHDYDGREGKAATLFRSVPRAKGEIIVFSDANAMYEKDAIRKLVRNFGDERIGCVSGQLRYTNPEGTAAGSGEGIYWRYEMCMKSLESRLFSLLGANGSIFAMCKELYRPMTRDRGDDFELPIRIRLKGRGVILDREAVSWERSSDDTRDEFRRKVRIITWNMKSCLLLLKESVAALKPLLFVQLISHKLLRWLVPVFALGLLVSNLFLPGLMFTIILAGQAVFYGTALAGCLFDRMGGKIPNLLLVPYYFCLVHWAAMVGVYRLFAGEQKTLWEKVRN